MRTNNGTGRDIAAALDADQKQVDNVVRLLRVDGRISVVGERDLVRKVTQKLKVFGVPKATPAKVETL